MPIAAYIVDGEYDEFAKDVDVRVEIGDASSIAFGGELHEEHVGGAVETIDEKADEKLRDRVDPVFGFDTDAAAAAGEPKVECEKELREEERERERERKEKNGRATTETIAENAAAECEYRAEYVNGLREAGLVVLVTDEHPFVDDSSAVIGAIKVALHWAIFAAQRTQVVLIRDPHLTRLVGI